ncbi:protein-L-isoaspartate(D-aspartate) O-methyltransferase [Seonamhaeicola sp.]|uniref:protein-L-isoaspartate(D-aspartate) O-methyltransferase n=1 Tax=Seonamhaeicola sp. TaxID=1912245 RepID=UPI00262820BF|nr:protein-L-isoaspartate(D-aspartate) O-methyltransferase [Seonamhaeicola sp.]
MKYWVLIFVFYAVFQVDPYASERKRMVKHQIEARGITHKATLKAMYKVPRHHFVPKYMVTYAYEDRPLPIGNNQTISQPYIVAYMTATISPKSGMKVLEVGTGSGYQAAVLAEIVDHVYTIEIIPKLAQKATNTLDMLGYENVTIRSGDGYLGWEEHAPFDAVIVTAALNHIPQPLIEQLKEGGSLVMPVGKHGEIQALKLLKKRRGKTTENNLMAVRFVPFTGKQGK